VGTTRTYRERIRCPKCGLVQKAIVRVGDYHHIKEHTCIGCGHEMDGMQWDVVNTYATEKAICPLCGYEIGYYADLIDCDDEVVECEHCGKKSKLSVEMKLEFTSTSDCELNDGEHNWEETTFITSKQDIYYHCTICDATKSEPRDE
jgi:DNA-directed RNA polymerase subunit RPC12/RpoP